MIKDDVERTTIKLTKKKNQRETADREASLMVDAAIHDANG